jgi:hypothetical protein
MSIIQLYTVVVLIEFVLCITATSSQHGFLGRMFIEIKEIQDLNYVTDKGTYGK